MYSGLFLDQGVVGPGVPMQATAEPGSRQVQTKHPLQDGTTGGAASVQTKKARERMREEKRKKKRKQWPE